MRSVDTEGHLRGRDEGLVNELLLEHHAITWSVPWYDALVTPGVQRLRDKTKKNDTHRHEAPAGPGPVPVSSCRAGSATIPWTDGWNWAAKLPSDI